MRELTSEELALVTGGWNPLPAIGHAAADAGKDAIDTGKIVDAATGDPFEFAFGAEAGAGLAAGVAVATL